MPEHHRWDLYMLEACERITSYTAGMDQTAFLDDRRTYDATLRNLELVGEAATHVPDSVRTSHAEIPWRDISGLGTGSFTPTSGSTTTSPGASCAAAFPG